MISIILLTINRQAGTDSVNVVADVALAKDENNHDDTVVEKMSAIQKND